MEFMLDGLLDTEVDNFQLPNPELLQFYHDLKENHVWLEDIGFDECKFVIKWLLAADRNPKETSPIYIHINSGGGDLDTMFTIYDIIKNMRRPVITINEGRCHSAALIIFLAGKTRLMRRYAQFVAHEGSANMGGSAREMKQAQMAYERCVEDMRQVIVDETNITYEKLSGHFDKDQDWYIDYPQAKELGLLRETSYQQLGVGSVVLDIPLTIPGYARVD